MQKVKIISINCPEKLCNTQRNKGKSAERVHKIQKNCKEGLTEGKKIGIIEIVGYQGFHHYRKDGAPMKNLDYVLLLDCYGSLLTERQRALLWGYYNEDLSLTELAEPLGISRQAVHDSIRRGERLLREFEEQMHIAERFRACRAIFGKLEALCETLPEATRKEITTLVEAGKSLL